MPPAAVTAYLVTMLILCRSLGALIYGAIVLPLIRFARPRLQVRLAMIFVIFALAYPLLRTADLIPTNYMLAAASSISAKRADSLQARFDQEQQLLDKARLRMFFGWGRYGRSRIFDEWGNDTSVTDGRWVITLGVFGLFGFLAEFGLLALAVCRAASVLRFAESPHDGVFLAALALIVAIGVVDLLPNSSLTSWSWLLAGALLGRTEALRSAALQNRRRDRLAGVAPDLENAVSL
jgi:hypothetical protein